MAGTYSGGSPAPPPPPLYSTSQNQVEVQQTSATNQQEQYYNQGAQQNAAPYQNVGYKPPRWGCNPCYCFEETCSLRAFCFVIGPILMALATVEAGLLAATPLSESDLKEKLLYPYTICDEILKNQSGYPPEHFQACKAYQPLRTIIVILGCVNFILSFASGVSILTATYRRSVGPALFAGVMLIFVVMTVFMEFQVRPWHLSQYPEGYSLDILHLRREKSQEEWEQLVWGTHEFFGILWAGGLIWPMLCCIQYGRQITAGRDYFPMYMNAPAPRPPDVYVVTSSTQNGEQYTGTAGSGVDSGENLNK